MVQTLKFNLLNGSGGGHQPNECLNFIHLTKTEQRQNINSTKLPETQPIFDLASRQAFVDSHENKHGWDNDDI